MKNFLFLVAFLTCSLGSKAEQRFFLANSIRCTNALVFNYTEDKQGEKVLISPDTVYVEKWTGNDTIVDGKECVTVWEMYERDLSEYKYRVPVTPHVPIFCGVIHEDENGYVYFKPSDEGSSWKLLYDFSNPNWKVGDKLRLQYDDIEGDWFYTTIEQVSSCTLCNGKVVSVADNLMYGIGYNNWPFLSPLRDVNPYVPVEIPISFCRDGELLWSKPQAREMAQQGNTQYRPGMFATERYLYAAQKDGLYRLEHTEDGNPTEWKTVAFAGIPIRQAVINGDSIIATTALEGPDSLLLLSVDGGKSFVDYTPKELWLQHRLDNTMPILPYSMTISSDDVLIVSVHNSGVYSSVDFGKTWLLLPDAIPGAFVAYNPNDSKQLFACYETMAMTGDIAMSLDNGQTWERVFSRPTVWINGLAFHPTDRKKVFAYGTGVSAVSNDQGYTWTNLFDYSTGDAKNKFFSAVVYDNIQLDVVYAVECEDNEVSIYRSDDGGHTWTMQDSISAECEVGNIGSLCIIGRILYINTAKGGVLAFNIDKGTEIKNQAKDMANPHYHDLTGRKVSHPTRGIYIKEGRKVMF